VQAASRLTIEVHRPATAAIAAREPRSLPPSFLVGSSADLGPPLSAGAMLPPAWPNHAAAEEVAAAGSEAAVGGGSPRSNVTYATNYKSDSEWPV